jgi:hypothetical protein
LNPIILADNRFSDAIPVAPSFTATGYSVLNCRGGKRDTLWKAAAPGINTIEIDCLAAKSADILGLLGHNLATAGALVAVEGRLYKELFDDATFNYARFSLQTAGSGAVAETTQLNIITAADADAAFITDKSQFVKTTPRSFRLRAQPVSVGNNHMRLLQLIASADYPAAGTVANWAARQIIIVEVLTDKKVRIRFYDATGTEWYWDGANKVWTDSAADAYEMADWNEWLTVHLVNDGTGWKISLTSDTAVLATTARVLWANTRSHANPFWLSFGDIFNDYSYGEMNISSYEVWTNILPYFTPASDFALLRPFTAALKNVYRLIILTETATPQLADARIGTRITLKKRPVFGR